MEELKRFRQFLAEGVEGKQVNEGELPKDAPEMSPSPAKKFLSNNMPEEWYGSWDNEANTYVAPYEKIELVVDDQDLPDSGIDPSQLPTDWVKFAEYSDMNNGQNYKMMNFAKYVPGEGLYMGVTTDKTDESAPNSKDYDMVKDLIKKGYSPEEAEATAARIEKDNAWLFNKEKMDEMARFIGKV